MKDNAVFRAKRNGKDIELNVTKVKVRHIISDFPYRYKDKTISVSNWINYYTPCGIIKKYADDKTNMYDKLYDYICGFVTEQNDSIKTWPVISLNNYSTIYKRDAVENGDLIVNNGLETYHLINACPYYETQENEDNGIVNWLLDFYTMTVK